MSAKFFDKPILNSPYDPPTRHWELVDGIPTDNIVEGRRPSKYITPVPPARRQDAAQRAMALGVPELADEGQEYDPTPIINDIRRRVDAWRKLPNSEPVGSDARDCPTASALARLRFSGSPAIFLPDRGGRNCYLAD